MSGFITEADLMSAIQRLDFLSTQFRREYFGRDRLRKLEAVMRRPLDPAELLELIIRKAGVSLLAERPERIGKAVTSIRRKLLDDLDDAELESLFKALRPRTPLPTQRGRIVSDLADFKWHRGSASALKITRALGLPPSFSGERDFGRPDTIEEILPLPGYKEMHPFQRGLTREIKAATQSGRRLMVSSFTGTGKTRIAMEHVCECLRDSDESTPCVVWVAQKIELLEQAIDCLTELWPFKCGGRSLHVVRYFGGNDVSLDEVPEGPVVVFTSSYQATLRLEDGDDFISSELERAFLVIIDEAHFALAPGHQRIINTYQDLRGDGGHTLIGLTATPGRSDILDPTESRQLAALFGGRLVVPKTPQDGRSALQWFQDQGYLATIAQEIVEVKSQVAQTFGKMGKPPKAEAGEGEDFSSQFLQVVGEDSVRNREIIEVLKRLYKEARRTLVFCCTIAQTEILLELLTLNGIPAGIVHNKIDKRDRRATIEKFKSGDIRILLNVEVLTTGFDAPQMDAIVMCRPTLSRILYEQMLGRGLRGPRMGGTLSCLVVDFTDNFGRYQEPMAWEAWWGAWADAGAADTLASAAPEVWEVVEAEPVDEET